MNNWVIIGCAILLVVLLFLSVLWGCACKDKDNEEGFENIMDTEDGLPPLEPISGVSDTILTAKEKELFEDLRANKLNDKEIHDMVKSGELTENTIEKFLANLDSLKPKDLIATKTAPVMKKSATNVLAAEAAKNEEKIEAFTGSSFASW